MPSPMFTGSVPPGGDTSNVRDAIYRAARLQVPMEVVLTYDPVHLADTPPTSTEYVTAANYYGGPPGAVYGPDTRALYVLGRYYHSVQFHSLQTASYTARMEGSLDGLVWTSLGTGTTSSDTIITFTGTYKYLRLNVSAISTAGADTTKDYGLRAVYIGIAQQ